MGYFGFSAVMDKARFEAGGFCDVCKMAVRYVDGILEQNATQAQIEEAVRKVCDFLPDAVKDEVCPSRRDHHLCQVNRTDLNYRLMSL